MAALNRSVIEEMLKETRVALQESLIFSIQHSCQVCGEGMLRPDKALYKCPKQKALTWQHVTLLQVLLLLENP